MLSVQEGKKLQAGQKQYHSDYLGNFVYGGFTPFLNGLILVDFIYTFLFTASGVLWVHLCRRSTTRTCIQLAEETCVHTFGIDLLSILTFGTLASPKFCDFFKRRGWIVQNINNETKICPSPKDKSAASKIRLCHFPTVFATTAVVLKQGAHYPFCYAAATFVGVRLSARMQDGKTPHDEVDIATVSVSCKHFMPKVGKFFDLEDPAKTKEKGGQAE